MDKANLTPFVTDRGSLDSDSMVAQIAKTPSEYNVNQ